VKSGTHRNHAVNGDVGRQKRVEGYGKPFGVDVNGIGSVEVNALGARVNPCVGAPRPDNETRNAENDSQSLFYQLLDADTVRLILPAAKSGAVIFYSKEVSHVFWFLIL